LDVLVFVFICFLGWLFTRGVGVSFLAFCGFGSWLFGSLLNVLPVEVWCVFLLGGEWFGEYFC
jgi:hypothetical protein